MSEAQSSPNFNANLIPTALQLDTALRTGAADLAHLLQFLAVGDAAVPGAGIVFGGLVISGKVDDMRVDVAAGYGAVYNSAVTPPEHPLEAVVLREDDVSPLLDDGDGTDPRIDVISIDPSSSLFDQEPLLVPNGGGATQDAYTRRGPGYTIIVTGGVPGPSPVAPSTPTGALKLYEILVPAGMVASGGGTGSFPGVVITDYRNRAGLAVKGPDSPLSGWVQQTDDFSIGGVSALLTALGVRADVGKALSYGISYPFHLPVISRSGAGAGEYNGALYPMLLRGDRTHELSAPFNAGDPSDADASVNVQGFGALGFGGVRVVHLTANAASVRASATFLTPARGASFGVYKLQYEIENAEPSTLAARAVAYDSSADAVVNLSDLTSIAKTVGSHIASLDNPVEFDPAEGDLVGIRVDIDFAAAADNSALELRRATARITEGRA